MAFRTIAATGLCLGAAFGIVAPAAAQASRQHPQITISNQRSVPLMSFEIATAGEQPRLVAKLVRPLAPGKTVALKLARPQGCAYSVQGAFDDESTTESEMDLCKDRVIRLTE